MQPQARAAAAPERDTFQWLWSEPRNRLSAEGLRKVLELCSRCEKLRILKLYKNVARISPVPPHFPEDISDDAAHVGRPASREL